MPMVMICLTAYNFAHFGQVLHGTVCLSRNVATCIDIVIVVGLIVVVIVTVVVVILVVEVVVVVLVLLYV